MIIQPLLIHDIHKSDQMAYNSAYQGLYILADKIKQISY